MQKIDSPSQAHHSRTIRRRRMATVAACAALLACTTFAYAQFWFAPSWQTTFSIIETKFPNVHDISSVKLTAMLSTEHPAKPILLDIRTKTEFDVSHLQNAQLAPDITSARRALAAVDKNEIVIVYCSVGYRSSEVAEQLMHDGYRNIKNLRGGIFQWRNEGRPVYRGNQPVSKVHPFDRRWGSLLKTPYRSAL